MLVNLLTLFPGLQRSLDSFVANQETRAILDWISMATPSLQQRDLIRRRQSGTGEWLLESKEIMNWIDTSGQTLFCPGNPGVGKTIATSIIIDHLQTTHGNKRIGVGYLFLNFQEKQKQQTMDLFLSLLRQLIRLPIPEAVKALHTEHSGRNTYPSFSEILNLLQEVIAGYSQVFFLVDALDECVDSLRFISELLKLQKKTGVNIYATSRFIPDITRLFREFPAIEIKFPNEDIQRYLDEAMPLQLRPFILEDASLRAEILNKAIEVSDGVYVKLLPYDNHCSFSIGFSLQSFTLIFWEMLQHTRLSGQLYFAFRIPPIRQAQGKSRMHLIVCMEGS